MKFTSTSIIIINMKTSFLALICALFSTYLVANPIEINVSPGKATSNQVIMEALKKASDANGQPVVINLERATYYLSRAESEKKLYYISNTTSEVEDPDPTKHIGLLLKGLKNVTIQGNGSTFVMTGKMTSFVIDQSENIVFKNLNFDYQFPTQTEIKVLEESENELKAQVHPTSQYRIDNGKLEWYGDGWGFSKGIAQAYDYEKDITWRTWSPMDNLLQTEEIEPNVLRMQYSSKPMGNVGLTYQIRDAIRDEVCGFVQQSKNVAFEDVNFYYLGNFGIVGQYSENITFDHCWFAPEPGSGRTNAGFADFLQMSGCKGLIDIKNSHFSGAHDDPINIHGTHLQVMEFVGNKQVKLKFMHHQSYGFEAFFEGDEVEFINRQSLLSQAANSVVKVEQINPREVLLTLKDNISSKIRKHKDLVVENVTWTPEVKVSNNYFTRIPSRGLLVTTRRKVLVEGNIFYGMQMSGILIADDALSWYESGMAKDVTIRQNTFIDCKYPIINIAPENRVNEGAVHRNILIDNNTFKGVDGTVVQAKSVDGLTVTNNLIILKNSLDKSELYKTIDCTGVVIEGNRVE